MRRSTALGSRTVEAAIEASRGHEPIHGYPAHHGQCGGALRPPEGAREQRLHELASVAASTELQCSSCGSRVLVSAEAAVRAEDAEQRYRAALERGGKPVRFAELARAPRRAPPPSPPPRQPELFEGGPILLGPPALRSRRR